MLSSLTQEAILCSVLWQHYSPEDYRKHIQNLAEHKLLSVFQEQFMFTSEKETHNQQPANPSTPFVLNEETIKPVLYNESSMIRRAIITSLALIRDKDK